jgi:hypothetical protein
MLPFFTKTNKTQQSTGSVGVATAKLASEMEMARADRALRMLSNINRALVYTKDEATLLNDACRIV